MLSRISRLRRRGGGIVVNLTNAEQAVYFDNDNLSSIYYPIERTITDISTRDIQALAYSIDNGETWNNVSLPFSGTLNIQGEILWKAASSTNNGFLYLNTGTVPTNATCERCLYFSTDSNVIRDYYPVLTNITFIAIKDVQTVEYSTDGINYNVVTLPLSAPIQLQGDIWWRATIATDRLDGFIYANNGREAIQSIQERTVMFDSSLLVKREFFGSPVVVDSVNVLNGLTPYYSRDGFEWFPLGKSSMLFDSIYFKITQTDVKKLTHLNIIAKLDTTEHVLVTDNGQSNCLGNAAQSTDIRYGSTFHRVFVCGNTSQNWDIMRPGVNDNVAGSSGPNAGFASAFVNDAEYSRKYLFYYKYAIGGKSLYYDWDMTSSEKIWNSAYNVLFPQKLRELINRRVNFKLDVELMMWGEQDSANETYANAWKDSITAFFNNVYNIYTSVRSEFGITSTPCIRLIVKHKTGLHTYDDIVRSLDDSYVADPNNRAYAIDAMDYATESTTGVHHTINELVSMYLEQYRKYKLYKI